MTLALDSPVVVDSPLSRLDPRWRLTALLTALLVVVVLKTLPAAILAFAGTLVLAGITRLPLRWYGVRIIPVGLFLALFALPLPFVLQGEPRNAGRFVPGLELAALILLRGLAVMNLVLVLLAAGPPNVTLQAAQSLRVPGLLIGLAMLTYRYIHLLGAELARLRVAFRLRGYRNRLSWHSYRTIGHVAGTLLVRGHERADRLGQCMRCRGFAGRFHSLTAFRTTVRDVATFLAIAGAAAGLLAWDVSRLWVPS